MSLSLTWWAEGQTGDLGVRVTELFEDENPDVRLTAEYSSFSGYYDKLATQVAGGNPPDIFQLHITTLAEYAKRGACRALDDLWEEPLGLSQAPEGVQASCRVDGTLYFVPLGLATQPAVLYNKPLLEELGIAAPDTEWTLDDMREFGHEVYEASDGSIYGITEFGGHPQGLSAFLRSRGSQLFTESGELGFGEDDLHAWYSFWKEMRDSDVCVPMDVTASGTGFENNPMITGQAALTFTPSSKGIQGMQNITDDELALLPFPRYDEGAGSASEVAAIEWFALSSNLDDEQAELAARLCNFWLTDPEALSATEVWHGVPVLPELRDRPDLSPNEQLIYDNVALLEGEGGLPALPYAVGGAELLDSVHGQNNQAIGFDEITVDEAVEQFFQEAERVLET